MAALHPRSITTASYVWRRPEKEVRLRGKPASAEVQKVDETARDRAPAVGSAAGRRPAKSSFIDVSQRYCASPSFTRLDASIRSWQKRHVRDLRDTKAETPGSANTLLKALRALFPSTRNEDIVDADPTRDVKRLRYVSKGHHTGTLDEVAQFERR